VSPTSHDRGYAEVPPPLDLGELVRCVWLRRVGDGELVTGPVRVLPDNCADWIFDLSAAPDLAADHGEGSGSVRALAVGPMTRPILVASRPGAIVLGLRFQPGRWRALLGGEAAAMRDRRCDLLGLDGEAAVAARRLLARLLEARHDRARVAVAVDELRALRRSMPIDGADPLVVRAIGAITARAGDVRIDELSSRLGCTRQHLAARFRNEVGLTPKAFAAVCRFRGAVAAGRGAGGGRWADVALRLGYSDQSHLLRDFRRFAGAPPSRLS
jgi:AraC-like DNA-binding protein